MIKTLIIDSSEAPAPDGLFGNLTNCSVTRAGNGLEGLQAVRNNSPDVLLMKWPIADWTPEELLEEIQRINALLPVILWNPAGQLDEAIRIIKLGAFHYYDAEPQPASFARQIESAVEFRRSRELALFGNALGVAQEPWRRDLIGSSRAMQNISQVVRLIGSRRCTVLITGETGTGKEMVARAIHMASPRAHLPMVTVNCNALPENLLEAELFGHVKGAFTGAVNNRVGRFEQAHRSTLFLDEIGDMPIEIQTKLLRVLQEREFQRLGSSDTIRTDVRVLAATNFDLMEQIRRGRFREDLYYRLNVVPISVPPLRERGTDIPSLVLHFIDKICRQESLPPKQVYAETLDRLTSYSWPGNVRQLENAVEMAIALSGDRLYLYPGDFPLPSWASQKSAPAGAPMISVPDDGLDFEMTVGRIERNILEQALRKTGGNKKLAADMLRLKRTTLTAKLKSLEAAAGYWQTAAPGR